MAAAAVVCAVGERTGLLNIMWAVTTNDSRVMMMETMLSADDTIIAGARESSRGRVAKVRPSSRVFRKVSVSVSV